MAEAITFAAAVARVRTLVDGGIRVEFDLSEDQIPAMAMLAEARRQGIVLRVSCEAEKQEPKPIYGGRLKE